jgi:hypothetical protein
MEASDFAPWDDMSIAPVEQTQNTENESRMKMSFDSKQHVESKLSTSFNISSLKRIMIASTSSRRVTGSNNFNSTL